MDAYSEKKKGGGGGGMWGEGAEREIEREKKERNRKRRVWKGEKALSHGCKFLKKLFHQFIILQILSSWDGGSRSSFVSFVIRLSKFQDFFFVLFPIILPT